MQVKIPAMKNDAPGFQERIDRWVAYPGITAQEFAHRKLNLLGLVYNLVGSLILLVLAVRWALPVTSILMMVLVLLIGLSLAGVYYRWLDQQDMYFLIEIWSTIFGLVAMVLLGGIPHSGGFIFLGLTAVMTSMLLRSFQRVRIIFFLFLLSVLAAGVLQPLLSVEPELSAGQNLLFFVMLAIGFSVFMFQFNRAFWNQRLEMEQLKIRQLQEVDELKTRLFTNISHEFRTPLTVILGMARQIRQQQETSGSEGATLIERNGRRLLQLVNQMLDLAKLESGSVPMNYVRTDAIKLLAYFLESFHSIAEEKKIKLLFRTDLPELVMDLDVEKLEQVTGNLLGNALKFTPEGGTVVLHCERVEACSRSLSGVPDHEQCLLIRVSDTGPGISAEYVGRVFDRFFQGDPVNQNGDGFGIGLSIVREYVHLMEGKVEVSGTPEAGTVFSIYLPVRQQVPVQEAGDEPTVEFPEKEKAENQQKPLLLIIEDNSDVVRYLQLLLRNDYRLLVAVDGQQGIRQALERVPDIIISDVMMPGKDGFEVCQALKNDFRTNHIPIILLTARADMASRISGLQYGADAYLAKPFNREELFAELMKLIRLRKVLQQKYSRQHQASPAPAKGLNERFLADVNRLLERHYGDEGFGIRQLCEKLGISRTQLHRKLTALTGRSASHFIRDFRLRKARELLGQDHLTIAEVAYAVGFRDPNYFSRTFAEEFGQSPVALRQ